MSRTWVARVVGFIAGVLTPGGPDLQRLPRERVLLRNLRSVASRQARLLSDRIGVGVSTLYLFGTAATVETIPGSTEVWVVIGDGRTRLRAGPVPGGDLELSGAELKGLRLAIVAARAPGGA